MSTPASRNKRSKVSDRTPHSNSKKSKAEVCPICDVVIRDCDDKSKSDDALYCEGDCQSWLHRKCVGMTRKMYIALGQSEEVYYCPHCKSAIYQEEINGLKNTIKDLSKTIADLKSKVDPSDNINPATKSLQESQSMQCRPAQSLQALQPGILVANPPAPQMAEDRKFNAVIYGIKECPQNTSRAVRQQTDLDIMNGAFRDANIQVDDRSIKDFFRLGKFKPDNTKPRPILVKFLRSNDAEKVKRSSFSSPIFAKPDLSPAELAQESVLLRARWDLIRQDIDHKRIKIKRNSVYLDNKIYGSYNGSQFQISGSIPSSSVQDTVQSNVTKVISTSNQLTGDSVSDKSSLQPTLDSVSNKSQL